MCGIAGIFSPYPLTPDDLNSVEKMNAVQQHRGPDDEGFYQDRHCALGHRRLAIIDLSKDGRQPFSSQDGRYQLTYNGEIFNYIELREDLISKGWHFRTRTDTEVLLAAYQEYGTHSLRLLNGMFAFVIYDTQERKLFMARDRFGIKPLYYTIADQKLVFASEIKALKTAVSAPLSLNQLSLFDYLVFNRTDVYDQTFFNEINRLPKGCYATYDGEALDIETWWEPLGYAIDNHNDDPSRISSTIEELLISAVTLRMRSDVPVGSCLSGGLDSSILLGILSRHYELPDDYATYTASFPGHPIDETRYVDALGDKFTFNNFRTFPDESSALANLNDFVYANDEPTTNSSFYSQYEVMRIARENGTTVLLDGQGGDESFAGYQYFHGFFMYGLFRRMKWLQLIKELYSCLLRQQHITAYQTLLFQLLPDAVRKKALLNTMPTISRDFFYEFVEHSRIFNEFFHVSGLNQSLAMHFKYKLEHLLRMEDRNSMAFSLEARVPYLDFRLVEYTLGVPEQNKISAGETKWLQKKAAGQYTVPMILERTDKIGFGTPADEWMQQPEWQELTTRNHSDLQQTWPDVFVKNSEIPPSGLERWKINQLATWEKLFLN